MPRFAPASAPRCAPRRRGCHSGALRLPFGSAGWVGWGLGGVVARFSPGPAVLPLGVLQQAQRDLVALPGVGMSVLEISHRSKAFEAILAEARSLLRELLGIPAGYQILFLQGGSSLQFSMLPMNFLASGKSADYIVTGTWGGKALEAAGREGDARAAWDGKAENYSRLPAAAN